MNAVNRLGHLGRPERNDPGRRINPQTRRACGDLPPSQAGTGSIATAEDRPPSGLDRPGGGLQTSVMHKPFLLALVCGFTAASMAAERRVSVTIEAGDFDRRETPVTFPLPRGLGGFRFAEQGDQRHALQTDGTNATLRLGVLPRGTTARFVLVGQDASSGAFDILSSGGSSLVAGREATALGFHHVQVPRSGSLVTNRLFAYQAEPGPFPRDNIKALFRRGGYLHPLHTPRGHAVVTDDFPPNHVHHHGVWWAWTKTEFDGRKPDFWNMGDGKGRVEFVGLDAHWSGPLHAGFRSRHNFIDLTGARPAVALHESWQVTAYTPYGWQDHWFFDLVSEQRCASTNALKLPEYHYGGIGLRGNWAWNGATNAQFLTSEGETDRVKAHAQRARWCDMSGLIDGQAAGIAVLCHPSNFRAPQPMRVHPGEPFFCYAPQQLGDMAIKPGDTYVSRYRIVVHDGPANRAELDRLWNDYAHPPIARVTVAP
ncbi:MAG TPA: PmoA family protein [Longimicrobium sp.]